MSAAPSITLERVSKWYGEVLGLNDVSATFGAGVSGLLGPNGAGKSTLLKLVCGMLKPSLGRCRVNGRAPFGAPGVMRRVGLCPEQDAWYPGVSALDTVAYLTRLQGFPRTEARRRARQALERAGLEGALKRGVGTYSKGMRQRFKLAQALAHDPDVVVLDEPLNGLDPPGRREMAAVIRGLGAEGRCVLVSSHVLHEVESVARRILVLHAGRVLADGTAREIREELSDYPLTVRITSPQGPRLAARLVELEGVERVERLHDAVEVRTREPGALFDRVAALADEGFEVRAIVPMDEDLESVFRYLTE